MIGKVSQPPYQVSLDTNNYPIGVHTVEAVAFGNSPVVTQGADKQTVMVINDTSAVSRIGEAFIYENGQSVKLTAKTVTAGTSEVGDSFFIEEDDRSWR